MATIDYKEKYEQALEVAQRFYNNSVAITKKGLEDIFPELAGSEDERIRKRIIDLIKEVVEDDSYHVYRFDEMIAWLEKQGQDGKVWFYRDDYVRDKKQAYQDGIDNVLNNPQKYGLEKQGEKAKYHEICDKCVRQPTCQSDCFLQQSEQKPIDKVEPKFKIGQIIKKEGFNTGFTIASIINGFYYNDEGDYFPFTDQDNWELVEEPKKCMFTKDDFTEEDRKILCEECEEECEYAKKEEPVSGDFEMALAEMIDKAKKCVVELWVVAAQWKDELVKLAKGEKFVSSDLEDAASSFARKDSKEISNPANFYYTVADKARIFKAGAEWMHKKMIHEFNLKEE